MVSYLVHNYLNFFVVLLDIVERCGGQLDFEQCENPQRCSLKDVDTMSTQRKAPSQNYRNKHFQVT